MQQKQEAAKPQAYVPPHLRNRPASATPTVDPLKAAKMAEGNAPRKLNQMEQAKAAPAEFVQKDKKDENQKRREREKKKKEAEKAEKEAQAKAEEEAIAKKKADEQAAVESKRANLSESEVLEKQLKKLQKTLKQIQVLEDKKKAGGDLDASQKKKLASMAGLLKEIEDIEARMKA